MSGQNELNKALSNVFTNGRVEVGLEVGADPGLSPDEYIQIPKSFIRRWAAKKVGAPDTQHVANQSVDSLMSNPDWVSSAAGYTHIRSLSGFYTAVKADGSGATEVDVFRADPVTTLHVQQFVAANIDHIRAADYPADHQWWVLGCRFWSVVFGMATTTKSNEVTVVETPTIQGDAHLDIVERIVTASPNLITALAARAASWRKSNHCTGGEIAAGFPRRWLQKNGWWPTASDASSTAAARKSVTTAFYVATHATSVHAVLSQMAPTDSNHWSSTFAQYGFMMDFEVMESTMIRIAPSTQVAGTAMVVDAMVVAQLLVSEGLAPLLENGRQLQSLKTQFDVVKNNGIRTASYAGWFLDGHPQGVTKIPFSQKSGNCAELIGELGSIARSYYRRSTIGESLALENASLQLATETSKTRWTSIARAKSSASNEVVIAAYQRIQTGASGSFISNLTSSDQSTFAQAVDEYNRVTRSAATILDQQDYMTMDSSRLSDVTVTPSGSGSE